MTRHDPQRRATDDGVLRCFGNGLPVRQRTHFKIKLGFRTDTGITGRTFGEERTIARPEIGSALVTTARIDELSVLCPLGHF